MCIRDSGGGGDSHHRRGGGNSGGGGSASGGGDSRHRAHFGRGHRSGGRSFGGGRGGRRDRARGRDSDSSTLSSSSVSSSDHGPVTVATDSSQAAPSLVDVASSAESLSKLTATENRAKPVSPVLPRLQQRMLLLMRNTKPPFAARMLPSVSKMSLASPPYLSRLRKQRCGGTATDSIGKSNYDGNINAQR